MKIPEQTEYEKQKWKRCYGWLTQLQSSISPIISCSTYACSFFFSNSTASTKCCSAHAISEWVRAYLCHSTHKRKRWRSKAKRKTNNENYVRMNVQWNYDRHNYIAPFARASYTISRNENEKRRSREMPRTNTQRVPWLEKKMNEYLRVQMAANGREKKNIETKQLRINR